jgi:hypothetical protein
LPQTVLRGDEALSEEEVFGRLRVNVSHAPRVSYHFDGLTESGKLYAPGSLRKRGASLLSKII